MWCEDFSSVAALGSSRLLQVVPSFMLVRKPNKLISSPRRTSVKSYFGLSSEPYQGGACCFCCPLRRNSQNNMASFRNCALGEVEQQIHLALRSLILYGLRMSHFFLCLSFPICTLRRESYRWVVGLKVMKSLCSSA